MNRVSDSFTGRRRALGARLRLPNTSRACPGLDPGMDVLGVALTLYECIPWRAAAAQCDACEDFEQALRGNRQNRYRQSLDRSLERHLESARERQRQRRHWLYQ